MRAFLFFAFFCACAFGYKDAFFIGGYGGLLDGTLEKSAKADLESDTYIEGVRLGWNNNMRSPFLGKVRWEFYYERRDFTYDFEGAKKTEDGWQAGASVALGYNVDWFLTQELVPYFKIGSGIGGFGGDYENGSNLNLGVGVAFAFRLFE
ncbi:MAG: hypothetical protein LBQ52_09500, partial [Helicobacteraceae bacterium]|nr:hypothetical protein [Helicobacteraceae bacterium]